MDSGAVIESIKHILSESYSLDREVTPDAQFTELELDSLVLLELSVILERRFGVRIPEDELAEAGSANAVAALLEERRSVRR